MMRLARARSRDGEAALERITLSFAGLMALGTLVLALTGQRASTISKAAAWTAPGSACPLASAQAVRAFGAPASSVFHFDGVTFSRAYGYARCGEITTDLKWGMGQPVPVCQFNTPGVVEVATSHGRFQFITGIAPVTITVARGVPTCVLGAKLEPDWRRE